MKAIRMGVVVLALAASGAWAQTPADRQGIERGTLGYDALMSNDNAGALRQLLADRSAQNDPARLINIGRAHARLGDKAKARKAFEAAAKSTEEVDLVLADGSIMGSRKAALLALKSLD